MSTRPVPRSVDDYIAAYGFCNWQAQEVIQQRDEAERQRDDARSTLALAYARLEPQVESLQAEVTSLKARLRNERKDHRNAMGQVADDYRALEASHEHLRTALETLLQAIADRGDGYCTPEAEQAARNALESLT